MSCFAVWTKQPIKQIRVYPYNVTDPVSRQAAKVNALDLANAMHGRGTACAIEEFGLVDVGVLVYDTEDPMKLHKTF